MDKHINSKHLIYGIVNTPSRIALQRSASGENVVNELSAIATRQNEILDLIDKMPAADVFEVEPFKEKAQFAIEATDSKDTYSTGLRNGIRYCLALIDGKEPEYEQCQESDEIKKALEKQIPKKPPEQAVFRGKWIGAGKC